jgi:excisionase family DNA binding protein
MWTPAWFTPRECEQIDRALRAAAPEFTVDQLGGLFRRRFPSVKAAIKAVVQSCRAFADVLENRQDPRSDDVRRREAAGDFCAHVIDDVFPRLPAGTISHHRFAARVHEKLWACPWWAVICLSSSVPALSTASAVPANGKMTFITVAEAAMQARTHPETIRRWIREEKFEARKLCGQYRIAKKVFDRFLVQRER